MRPPLPLAVLPWQPCQMDQSRSFRVSIYIALGAKTLCRNLLLAVLPLATRLVRCQTHLLSLIDITSSLTTDIHLTGIHPANHITSIMCRVTETVFTNPHNQPRSPQSLLVSKIVNHCTQSITLSCSGGWNKIITKQGCCSRHCTHQGISQQEKGSPLVGVHHHHHIGCCRKEGHLCCPQEVASTKKVAGVKKRRIAKKATAGGAKKSPGRKARSPAGGKETVAKKAVVEEPAPVAAPPTAIVICSPQKGARSWRKEGGRFPEGKESRRSQAIGLLPCQERKRRCGEEEPQEEGCLPQKRAPLLRLPKKSPVARKTVKALPGQEDREQEVTFSQLID